SVLGPAARRAANRLRRHHACAPGSAQRLPRVLQHALPAQLAARAHARTASARLPSDRQYPLSAASSHPRHRPANPLPARVHPPPPAPAPALRWGAGPRLVSHTLTPATPRWLHRVATGSLPTERAGAPAVAPPGSRPQDRPAPRRGLR